MRREELQMEKYCRQLHAQEMASVEADGTTQENVRTSTPDMLS